jgi:hypothetical protein
LLDPLGERFERVVPRWIAACKLESRKIRILP